jgi:hypothetical protein
MLGLAAIQFAATRNLPTGGIFLHLQRFASFNDDPETSLPRGTGAGLYAQGAAPDVRELQALRGRTVHMDATGTTPEHWGAWAEVLAALPVWRLIVTHGSDVIVWQAR